jgi:hypothetical protein
MADRLLTTRLTSWRNHKTPTFSNAHHCQGKALCPIPIPQNTLSIVNRPIMKSFASLFKNALVLFLLFTLLTTSFCTKEDEDEETTEREPVPAVNTSQPYVVLNVINPEDPQAVSFPTPKDYEYSYTPQYPADWHGKIVLGQSGDTVRSYWMFKPTRIRKTPQAPAWRFCDGSSYNPVNEDWFFMYCTWFKSQLGGDLKTGYRYNLHREGWMSNETYGDMLFWQYDTVAKKSSNSINTSTVNFNMPGDQRSWIEYSKIENNKASGTFRLLFSCTGGTDPSTGVLGKFENIPIE